MKPPPPLFSFDSDVRFLKAARSLCEPEELDVLDELIDKQLPPVSSVRSLAILSGFSRSFLVSMALRPDRYYRRFTIPKGRGKRTIASPRVALKVIQKWIGFHLSHAVTLPSHVHGFVPGRSSITAAQVHCPAKWVLSLDVEDFFGSVTKQHVDQILDALGYPASAKKILVPLLTLDEALPQGSPASPVLANLAFRETDVALERVAADLDVRLTRYADDITCSGESETPPSVLADMLTTTINRSGWVVNEAKTSFATVPDRCRVLGLLVHRSEPRLPKELRNRIKMIRHILEHEDNADIRFDIPRARGLLAYANSVERTV